SVARRADALLAPRAALEGERAHPAVRAVGVGGAGHLLRQAPGARDRAGLVDVLPAAVAVARLALGAAGAVAVDALADLVLHADEAGRRAARPRRAGLGREDAAVLR